MSIAEELLEIVNKQLYMDFIDCSIRNDNPLVFDKRKGTITGCSIVAKK